MITDGDITKLKRVFVTKEEFADLKLEVGELHDKIDGGFIRIENTLDHIVGAIQDLCTENGAGAAHLARHDAKLQRSQSTVR